MTRTTPTPASPAVGTCRCGALRMEITAPPLATAACHCRGCQKMSASAFSLTAMIPAQAFSVVSGELIKGGIKGPMCDHFFCPGCLTWVFTRIPGMDGFVNVRSVMFDVPAWTDPFIETMCAEKLAWASTPARHSYEGFPPPEDLEPLMREYAASL
ncbi:MAG: GFA family protein [Rhodobacteraceae bacterium]|nr:GFA family protein [Paracoccaceae bacterium]